MVRRLKRSLPPDQRHMMFNYWLIDSAAFRALPGRAVKLMVLLARRFNGSNNGNIGLSQRTAAKEVGCTPNHITKLFRILVAMGFVEVTRRGHFHVKNRLATTYRLTWLETRDASGLACHPTKDFMRWTPTETPKATGQIQNTVVPGETNGPTP